MGAPSLGFVLPSLDEAASLAVLLPAIRRRFSEAHLVVVDDASRDGSADVAVAHGATVLRRPRRSGLASAIHDGLQAADCDTVVVMDADGSHRPEDVAALLDALATCDMAVGARWIAGGRTPGLNLRRSLWSRASNGLVRGLFGRVTADWTSGFWAVNRAARAAAIVRPPSARGWVGSLEVKWRVRRAGLRLHDVAMSFEPRTHGTSKLRLRDVAEAAFDLLRVRMSAVP